MAKTPMTVIRGGRVVDIKRHSAPKADILVKGDTIVEIGRPGLPAPPVHTECFIHWPEGRDQIV